MPPLVSVIIPAYNAARWIDQTIASVFAQTWPSIEVIVVDDGSTDDTLTRIRSLGVSRLRVISSKNCGASSARNLGVAAAQGRYVQYLDADDQLSPDKIAAQMERAAVEPPGRLFTSGIVYFNDDESPENGLASDGLPYAGDSDSPLDFLLRLYGRDGQAGMVQTSQWLVPLDLAKAAGAWDETLTVDDDGEYFARIVARSTGVRHVPRGCVYYRKHSAHGSLSAGWRRSETHLASAIHALHGKSNVLIRLGADQHELRLLASFYCEWALAAYPRFPALTHEALDGARHCGAHRPTPRLATPKGRFLQMITGWRIARRVQSWLE